jgi:surface polysaccharide O-acyltransferase-like enzyme
MAQARLFGVELFRAIAAFAVVVVHASGLILHSDSAPVGAELWLLGAMQIGRFAVPFFLAASFYFVIGKLLSAPDKFDPKTFLRSRVTRLMMPYALWSLIYLAVRVFKFAKTPEGIGPIFQDPIFLIFLGGAAIHLYFLPLLFTGSLLVPLLKVPVLKRQNWIVPLLISGLLYELLFVTGNSFDLGVNCLQQPQGCSVALISIFQAAPGLKHPLTRLLSVEFLWAVRCAMFIAASAMLHQPSVRNRLGKFPHWLWGALFGLAMLGGLLEHFKVAYFPLSLYELGVGYGPLLWGIALSRSLSSNALILRFGNASFGIYLVHYLILTLVFAIVVKVPTVTAAWPPVLLALLLSAITFGLSGIVTFWIGRHPFLKKALLGS